MQQFSLVYNNLFVFLEPVDEPRRTYDCGQLMQGSSSGDEPVHVDVPIRYGGLPCNCPIKRAVKCVLIAGFTN